MDMHASRGRYAETVLKLNTITRLLGAVISVVAVAALVACAPATSAPQPTDTPQAGWFTHPALVCVQNDSTDAATVQFGFFRPDGSAFWRDDWPWHQRSHWNVADFGEAALAPIGLDGSVCGEEDNALGSNISAKITLASGETVILYFENPAFGNPIVCVGLNGTSGCQDRIDPNYEVSDYRGVECSARYIDFKVIKLPNSRSVNGVEHFDEDHIRWNVVVTGLSDPNADIRDRPCEAYEPEWKDINP